MDCEIQPNAEIAGIGIRTSIYAQAVLTSILAGLSLFKFAVEAEITAVNQEALDIERVDPTKDEIEFLLRSDIPMRHVIKRLQRRYLRDENEDNRELQQSRMSVQLTGVALLVSALVQSSLYNLDVYHALVVLNLCWLNSITALTLYLTELFLRNPRDRWLRHPLPPRLWTIKGLIAANPFLPTSVYLCALGSYGFWLFIRLNTFGDDPDAGWNAVECNPIVLYWILGHPMSVTGRAFRIVGIVLHAAALIPVINLVIESYIMCLGAIYAERILFWPYNLYKKHTGHELHVEQHVIAPKYRHLHFLRTLVAIACIYVFFVIVFVLDSEEMIGANAPHISENEEDAWTFGQTLVMVLLIPLLWDIWGKSRETYILWKEKKEEDGVIERAVIRLREDKLRQEKERQNDGNGRSGGVDGDDSPASDDGNQVVTRAQTVV